MLQAFRGGDEASSLERGVQPSKRRAFSFVPFFTLPSSGRNCRSPGSPSAAMRTSQSGSCSVGTRLPASPIRRFSNRDVMYRQKVARDREEALAAGGVMRHRSQVKFRHVPHIDDAEVQPRAAGNGAGPSGAER